MNAAEDLENGNQTSVFEVIRETPGVIGEGKVFESALVIHNKGCAATQGTIYLIESVPTDWFPLNPGTEGSISSTESIDVESDPNFNTITWTITSTFDNNEYAVATYQIKAPNEIKSSQLRWNLTWQDGVSSKEDQEVRPFSMQTANYSTESH